MENLSEFKSKMPSHRFTDLVGWKNTCEQGNRPKYFI